MESARAWLAARGFEDRIRTFEVSSATVELAARALGVEPGRIAKTILQMVSPRATATRMMSNQKGLDRMVPQLGHLGSW